VTDKDSPPVRNIELKVLEAATRVTRQISIAVPGFHNLDPEAIVAKPDGGFWLASEGGKENSPPNVLIEFDSSAYLVRSIGLPDAIANKVSNKGFEGIAIEQMPQGASLFVAFQAPLVDDPEGVTRIGAVNPDTGQWTFFHYPLERLSSGDFTGLCDLVHLGSRRFTAIERDGKGSRNAIKCVTTFDHASPIGAPPETTPPMISKRVAVDLVPLFTQLGRKIEKEIEGLAVAVDGQVYAVTDNDNERPTVLLRLGSATDVFGPLLAHPWNMSGGRVDGASCTVAAPHQLGSYTLSRTFSGTWPRSCSKPHSRP
jgi:Esterase-like activity of phytase